MGAGVKPRASDMVTSVILLCLGLMISLLRLIVPCFVLLFLFAVWVAFAHARQVLYPSYTSPHCHLRRQPTSIFQNLDGPFILQL